MTLFVSKENPMTVVLAVWDTDGSILLGADSEQTDEDGLKSEIVKIQQVADEIPVMWSSVGNPAIGIHGFGQWLAGYTFNGTDWSEFSRDAADAWSRLNGEQRRLTEQAGVTLDEQKVRTYLADGVLAGWLGGEGRIVGLSSDGRVTPIPKGESFAAGSGKVVAQAVMLSMRYIQEVGTPLEHVQTSLETACQFAPNCGPPIEIWRITSSDCTRVLRGSLKLEFEGQSGDR